jgi:hypothetical protein
VQQQALLETSSHLGLAFVGALQAHGVAIVDVTDNGPYCEAVEAVAALAPQVFRLPYGSKWPAKQVLPGADKFVGFRYVCMCGFFLKKLYLM